MTVKNSLIKPFMLAVVGIFFLLPLHAQQNKHVIKVNVPGLFLTQVNPGVEVAVGEKLSLGLWVNWLPERGLGLVDNLLEAEDAGFIDDFSLGGVALTPELRFYPGNKRPAPHGFFIGPYATYASYGLKAPYEYTPSSSSEAITVQSRGFLDFYGGGFIIGNQWLIGEHFVIDLFGGLGIISANAGVSVKDDRLALVDFEEIRDELQEEIDIDSENITFFANNNKAGFRTSSVLLPHGRFGFSLGYSF
ncbi:MAG: DUF3575 domain-containing protein [Bacteroidota bacterium]